MLSLEAISSGAMAQELSGYVGIVERAFEEKIPFLLKKWNHSLQYHQQDSPRSRFQGIDSHSNLISFMNL